MNFHADSQVIDTRGKRGKSTAKRAKTNRGPEGQYIAQCKEELVAAGLLTLPRRRTKAEIAAARERAHQARIASWVYSALMTVFEVRVEVEYRGERMIDCGGWFSSKAAAEEAMKGFPLGRDSSGIGVVRLRVWIEGPGC